MTAKIIDGAASSAAIRRRLSSQISQVKTVYGVSPGLAVVLVGDNAASDVYVRNKVKQTEEVGMRSFEYRLPATTSEAEIIAIVDKLNRDPAVHGILIQLPLPAHIQESVVIEHIVAEKDVDGFHPENVGLTSTGQAGVVPCTPLGAMFLIKQVNPHIAGKNAVVIGRSNIVGKPMAHLLLAEHCTVTIAHSRSVDLPAIARTADILVAAVGRVEMVKGSWIKPGACVIDVGINRVPKIDGIGTRLVGDVAFSEAIEVAGSITPVPGGVGPMTIACLLLNTYRSACRSWGLRGSHDLYAPL